MEKLLDVTEKRELCYKIAEIYRQKAEEQETLGDRVSSRISSNLRGGPFSSPIVRGAVGGLGRAYCLKSRDDLNRKARRYEGLGNSRLRIHVIPTCILQGTLNRLKS